MPNITLTLDEETIAEANRLAKELGMSVYALFRYAVEIERANQHETSSTRPRPERKSATKRKKRD